MCVMITESDHFTSVEMTLFARITHTVFPTVAFCKGGKSKKN